MAFSHVLYPMKTRVETVLTVWVLTNSRSSDRNQNASAKESQTDTCVCSYCHLQYEYVQINTQAQSQIATMNYSQKYWQTTCSPHRPPLIGSVAYVLTTCSGNRLLIRAILYSSRPELDHISRYIIEKWTELKYCSSTRFRHPFMYVTHLWYCKIHTKMYSVSYDL